MGSQRRLGQCVVRGALGALWLALGVGAAEVPDYSQGFAKLLALGLPNVKGAAYVRLAGDIPGAWGSGTDGLRGPGRKRLRLGGNAWLVEEKSDGPSRLVGGQGQVSALEVWDRKAFAAHQRTATAAAAATATAAPDDGDPFRPGQGPQVGSWTPADLDKDIAAVLAFLAPAEAPAAGPQGQGDGGDEGDDDDDGGARIEIGGDSCGSLFLFAAHCHSAGRTQEANRIVQALFAQVRDRREVLTWALDILAGTQYGEHLDAFSRSGDWLAWAGALEALEARFRGAWAVAPAVKRVAAEARARATARPPAIAGEGITAEDSDLAEALADLRGPEALQAFLWSGHQLWLLPAGEDTPPGTDPISRIKARGPAALPLLAALAGDEYWTPIASWYPGMGASRYYHPDGPDVGAGADGAGVDAVESAYQSLRRPVTRGQIAVMLLRSVVPLDEETSAELGRGMMGMPGGGDQAEARNERLERLTEAAHAWQGQITAKAPVQIAELYLQKGTSDQRRQAMEYLLAHGGEASYPALEAAILAGVQRPDQPWEAIQLAEQYVMHRGPAAKDFVEKLATHLAAPAAPAPAQGAEAGLFVAGADAQLGAWAKEALPRLRRLVSPIPMDELLAQAQAGTLALDELWQSLVSQAKTTPPEEILGTLLKLAIAMPEADQRAAVVSYASNARYLAMEARREPRPGRPLRPEDLPQLDPKAHVDLWRPLLADERQGGDPDDPYAAYGNRGQMAVRDVAASAVEALYGPPDEETGENMATAAALGPRYLELLRARAEARLAGKPETELPPWPRADRVPQPRRDELVQTLRTADPATLPEATARLSLDELLAAGEAIEAEPDLAGRLLPVANRIGAVTLEVPATEATAPLTALQGQVLSQEAVRRVHAACLAQGKTGQRFEAALTRAPALGGVTLVLRALPEPKPPTGGATPLGMIPDADDPYTKAMRSITLLHGLCMASAPTGAIEPGQAAWPITDKAAPAVTPAPVPAPAAAAAPAGDRLPDAADDLDQMVSQILENIGDEDQQEAFWRSVEALCTDKGSLWSPATITFRCQTGSEGGMMF